MFHFQLDTAKSGFFDRAEVLKRVDKATARNLRKAGAFMRRRARSSIRKRKANSAPGKPPSSHAGQLRNFILYFYDSRRRSVVIGPARLSGKIGNAPESLETGGSSVARVRGNLRRGIKPGLRRIRIAARPFMKPAFDQEITKLPALWRDSVKR